MVKAPARSLRCAESAAALLRVARGPIAQAMREVRQEWRAAHEQGEATPAESVHAALQELLDGLDRAGQSLGAAPAPANGKSAAAGE